MRTSMVIFLFSTTALLGGCPPIESYQVDPTPATAAPATSGPTAGTSSGGGSSSGGSSGSGGSDSGGGGEVCIPMPCEPDGGGGGSSWG